ncbi:MAG: metallophosphoesterase [Candidatus Marinimicrobia bacterium]|nr:metallophosphoesterase [Candidatus Neomarinimicrobiota bacterium]
MIKIIGFTALIILFLGIQYYAQYEVFKNLEKFYNYKNNRLFLVIGLLTANLLIINIIVRSYQNNFTFAWYTISMSYIGLIWLLNIVIVLYTPFNYFLPISLKFSQYFLAIVSVSVVFIGLYSGLSIKQINTVIKSDKIENDIRIVQISDVHLGAVNKGNYLKYIVNKTNKLKPDIVAITGDLFDETGGITDTIISHLNRINAPIYFVTGNHENYSNVEILVKELEKTKMKVLRNQSTYHNDIQIVGIDDIGKVTSASVDSICNKLQFDENAFSIFLTHQPIKFDYLKNVAFNLQLAGHTHAGQIFPASLIVKLIYPCNKGLYEQEKKYIYVSQGVGTWGPPIRFFTNNELTVIDIKKG